ncbi:hypothetical protein [Moorena sp. SIO4A5]|uniref:hypothetical protein n=1 Tax=Moorena sp. SIO4A5 TaxID=2607838 RepID=UPI0013CD1F72|nr:hypothetical protein [Moorena sp. SIO4A5]NEO20978.1 hypothetical protein [Moorena sp. SIO4A5]
MRYTLFVPCSLFPVPCSLLPKTQIFVPHGYKNCNTTKSTTTLYKLPKLYKS